MGRDMQELVSQKQEEDLAVETTPTSCISCLNLDHDSPLVPIKVTMLFLLSFFKLQLLNPYFSWFYCFVVC